MIKLYTVHTCTDVHKNISVHTPVKWWSEKPPHLRRVWGGTPPPGGTKIFAMKIFFCFSILINFLPNFALFGQVWATMLIHMPNFALFGQIWAVMLICVPYSINSSLCYSYSIGVLMGDFS